ncbi:MAG: DUF348 domain-containing protein, partial [Clostridia bacterium]|nr:DUF348 domain-containing protein [Clostridia bacterium]
MMNSQDGRSFVVSLTSRVVAVALMVACCCGVMAGYATSTYTLNVFADGKAIEMKTSARNPNSIVAASGVTLSEDDKIDVSSFRVGSDIADGNAIIVYRALPVTIYDEGKKVKSLNAAGTVGDALEKAGIRLSGADATELDRDTLLKKNMKINILRAYKITLVADGLTRKVDYAVGTVSDVLKRAGITLGEYDTVKPGLSKTLKKGSKVVVKRVSYVERKEEKIIKFETQTKTTSVLAEGVERVARKGRDGVKVVTYEDKVVDGEVVSTKKLGETIRQKAVSKVVVKGTRVKSSSGNFTGSTAGAPTSYVKTFHGPATAYTGGGITAS